jgi:carbon-monoxide dehydrogenase medium subunit
MKDATCSPENLVDLNRISELNYIVEEDNMLTLGATITHSQALNNPLIKEKTPALYDALINIGSPQIRNRGTIIGNLCNASPAADSATPLLVHDAEVTIKSVEDTRIIPLDDLFEGPKINSLEPNELVTEVRVPHPPLNSTSSFHRIGRRKAFTLSVVNTAVYIELNDDICKEVRIAFGSVDVTPLRGLPIEELLREKELTTNLIKQVAEASSEFVHPITDIRGTAEYRKDMCGVLFERCIQTCLERMR